jgi:hypothetical protein
MLAGVAWIASGVIDVVVAGGQRNTSLQEVLFIVASAGTLAGLAGLDARQAPRYGWLGKAGFLTAFIGSTLLMIGLVLSLVFEGRSSNVPDLVLALGLLGALVGLVLLGVGTLRAGVLPQWCGLLLIICLPLSIGLGDYGGGIALGLIWLALGFILLTHRDVSSAMVEGSGNRS